MNVSAGLQGSVAGWKWTAAEATGSAPTHNNACLRIEMSRLLLNPTAVLLEMEIRKQAWRCGPEIPATPATEVGGL